MKHLNIMLCLLALTPIHATAQDYPDISKLGMNQMSMQKIQAMQTCMASVDQKQLQSIEPLQAKLDSEIKPLCRSGQRNEAQKKAMTYVKKMMNNPAIKAMQKCGEIAKDIIPEMPFMEMVKETGNQHVCDTYKQ